MVNCFDNYNDTRISMSNYIENKKSKIMFREAQILAVGNNKITSGYKKKSNGSSYYNASFIVTSGDNPKLISARSYDIKLNLYRGQMDNKCDNKYLTINDTWKGNLMQIDTSAYDMVTDSYYNDSSNIMSQYPCTDNYPTSGTDCTWPGIVVDPYYEYFNYGCTSNNDYSKNISMINLTSVQQTSNTKMINILKTNPYNNYRNPLKFPSQMCYS